MEAKDTVMSDRDIFGFILHDFHLLFDARRLANKQAEITGKIMYDEGFKAGQKEVAEWVNTHISDGQGVARWRAKLADWGL